MVFRRAAGCLGGAFGVGLWLASATDVTMATARVQSGAASNSAVPQSAAPSGLTARYCVGCHNDRLKTGDLSLENLEAAPVASHPDVWEKVVRRLRAESMPPAGSPRPDTATRAAFVRSLEQALDEHAADHPSPGRTATFHRLNRNEYQNAVRDLLALDVDVAQSLPPDGQNFGFDNIGEALTLSPLLLDRYLSVSRRVSRLAVGTAPVRPVAETYLVPSDQGGQDDRLATLPYGTRGGMVVEHYFPVDGEYEFAIKLARNYNFQVVDLNEPHQLEVLLDDRRVQVIDVKPLPGRRVLGGPEPDDNLKLRVPVPAGSRRVAVTFIRRPSAYSLNERQPFIRGDAKLNALHGLPWVGELTVTGPFGEQAVSGTPSRRRIFTCRPGEKVDESTCARTILARLARLAYRRPVTDADVDPLVAAFRDGRQGEGNFDEGIALALQRMLMSPSFLFRIELEPSGAHGPVYRVDDVALASRLSFFLWSSIPDDELLGLAERRRLTDPVVLDQQVRRLLSDVRSQAFVANFAGQWLELRKLDEMRPDQQLFPNFDGALRDGFRRETEMLFDSVLRADQPLLTLLTADHTFVNERLARHYGIPGVFGDRFRRVPVDGPRRGLLGHGSMLTLTSYANRTSPVLRGVWILDNLLGTPPPPPPPNVPDLADTNAQGRVLSMRERMEQHRKSPVCASCHNVMDPLGLSLENFDAVGTWRPRGESGEAIDSSGTLPDGSRFEGVDGLRSVLVQRREVFYQTIAEKLLIYALGRQVDVADAPAVRAILRDAGSHDYRAQSLIVAIARSVPFQMKQAASPAAKAH